MVWKLALILFSFTLTTLFNRFIIIKHHYTYHATMIITHDIIFIHVTMKNWLNTQIEFKHS